MIVHMHSKKYYNVLPPEGLVNSQWIKSDYVVLNL